MDIRQLRYFLAVAEEGQITAAAKRLNMEQPPLSRQMKLLEEELGVTLFDRSGKRLGLTQAGELLRGKAEGLLRQLEEARQEVRELDQGIHGVLSIGSVVSCLSLLPPRIERFHEQYPDVTFKIREGDHFLLAEQINRRSIELIVARLPFEAASAPGQYEAMPLPPDPFSAILPAAWRPSPGRSAMDIGELSQYPFLTLKSDLTTRMHERVLNEFRKSGHEPRILCECSSAAVIIALVAAGIGVTVLPKSVMTSFPLDNVSVMDLTNSDFHSDVGIVWLKGRYLSKRARRFIELF